MSNVFLGTEGITSTSANYYANMAKELVQADAKKLEELKFITTTMGSVVGDSKYLLTKGESDINWIQQSLNRISDMNTLCAWLREAIKSKEEMLTSLPTFEKWLKEYRPEVTFEAPKRPDSIDQVEEINIVKSWDMNKRLRYLELEAKASTFGKQIHPNGSVNKARDEAHKAASNPTSVDGTGREALIYYKEVTLPIETIDSAFMNLQSKYRSFEQELNHLKAEIKEEVNKKNESLLKIYQDRIREYNQKLDEYYALGNTLRNEYNIWLIDQKETISKLKIVIPSNLKSIYQTVVNASK